MGRTLAEDMALLFGFAANVGVWFGVASGIFKRVGWPAPIATLVAFVVGFGLSAGWLLVCERICAAKPGERRYGLRFMLLQWAPVAGLFVLTILLTRR